MEKDLEIKIEHKENSIEITLNGDLDSQNSEVFEERVQTLIDEKIQEYRIIMRDVRFIGNYGLGVCLSLNKIISESGGKLYFVDVNNNVRKTFTLLQVDKIFTIIDS